MSLPARSDLGSRKDPESPRFSPRRNSAQPERAAPNWVFTIQVGFRSQKGGAVLEQVTQMCRVRMEVTGHGTFVETYLYNCQAKGQVL